MLLLGIVGKVKVLLLTLFLCQQEFLNMLYVNRGWRLAGALEGPVM